MAAAVASYFNELVERFGQGWNRFWFKPSDPTTLSVLRLATGILASCTLLTYSFDLLRFFGPSGMLPARIIPELHTFWRFSYLDYIYDSNHLWVVHCLGLAVLVLYTAGAFTRITSVLSLVVMLSYFQRAPVLTAQFEPMLTLVMFYTCLGPAGARFSVDHWLARRKLTDDPKAAAKLDAPSSFATLAVRLLQVHLAMVYAMMAAGKLSHPVWWNGTAAWWLLNNQQSALFDLTWLRDYPKWVNALTHSIVAYQILFPVLIWNRLARPLLLGIGVAIWALIATLTGLVSFSLIMLIASLAFVEFHRSPTEATVSAR